VDEGLDDERDRDGDRDAGHRGEKHDDQGRDVRPEVPAQAPQRVHAGGRVAVGVRRHCWSTVTPRTDRPRILLYDAYPPIGSYTTGCGATRPGQLAISPRTTRRPTDIRARSALSSAQISWRIEAARWTTTV